MQQNNTEGIMNDRLNELVIRYEYGVLEKDEQAELIDSLIEETNTSRDNVEFYGEQLLKIKAENAKLKQQIKIKGVN